MIPPGTHWYFFSINMKKACVSDGQIKAKYSANEWKRVKLRVKKLDYEEIMGGGSGGEDWNKDSNDDEE